MPSTSGLAFSVFTKPWKTQPLAELARFVRGLGFDGIELPVRPGFQVEPAQVERDLPRAVRIFGDHGLKIFSVAGPADEAAVNRLIADDLQYARSLFPPASG